MTTLDTEDARLTVGDDYDVVRTITGVPDGATVDEGKLTIKKSEFDADEDAVIRKTVTTSISADGVITIDSVGTSVLFQLSAAETALLSPYEMYEYDIQVKTDTNKTFTRERGPFSPLGQITT